MIACHRPRPNMIRLYHNILFLSISIEMFWNACKYYLLLQYHNLGLKKQHVLERERETDRERLCLMYLRMWMCLCACVLACPALCGFMVFSCIFSNRWMCSYQVPNWRLIVPMGSMLWTQQMITRWWFQFLFPPNLRKLTNSVLVYFVSSEVSRMFPTDFQIFL